MNTRLVVVLTAVLACSAAELRAQDGSLTAFGSDRELTEFLRSLQPPPPPPRPRLRLRSRPPSRQPTPPGTYEGPMEQWPAVVTGRVTNAQGSPRPPCWSASNR